MALLIRIAHVCSLAAMLLLNACAGTFESREQAGAPRYHTIVAGETLSSIARQYGYNYRQIALWNDIWPPYRIYAGERLLITPPPASGRTVISAPSPRPPSGQAVSRERPRATETPPTVVSVPSRLNSVIAWQWPTEGKLLESFSDNTKGINIAGQEGQIIRAAASGQVVYSGGGLVRVGNLIIIKHDGSFLSAYGHNKVLLVKEGDEVSIGDAVAEMGQAGADRVMLYFEIRKEGKPVDPLLYLP